MWIRILIAGVVGGVIVFVMGFVCHGIIGLQTRTFLSLPAEAQVSDALQTPAVKPGIYSLPGMPQGSDANDPEKAKQLAARYKAGPSGVIVIAPTGEEMMSTMTLVMEFATNTIAALLAAWIVSLMAADVGFARRWIAVLAMGIFAWFSLSTSYGIWYRFPHDFIHDEFYCAVLEWGVAGLAVAAIVRPPARAAVPISATKA